MPRTPLNPPEDAQSGSSGCFKVHLGLFVPADSEGINVTIFSDGVESASIRIPGAFSLILGHAIAHEIRLCLWVGARAGLPA